MTFDLAVHGPIAISLNLYSSPPLSPCLTYTVTLPSVAELLEFAVAYSADQLKKACLQFISVNASSLLEARQARRSGLTGLAKTPPPPPDLVT